MATQIKGCRVCGSENLTDLMDLGIHTLSGRFPDSINEKIPAYPLVLTKCTNGCGLVQLKYNMNRDELYRHFYGYMSGINTTMRNHLSNLVLEIENKVDLHNGDTVIDIGSNDCTTLKFYSNKKLNRIGVDPTGEQFRELYTDGISLVSEYFDSQFVESCTYKAKVITSIAMFYDLPDPVEFAKNIKRLLHHEGIWVTEQSYLPSMLATNSFDTICHEHLEYYSFRQIEYIAEKAGLSIIGLSFNDINGGSFRITFSHKHIFDFGFPRIFPTGNSAISESVLSSKDAALIEDTRETEKFLQLDTLIPYQKFVAKCEQLKQELLAFLKKEKENGKSICVYGASTKGNVLLQYYGIDTNLVTCVAERNPQKYGKFTPKTLIPIKSEEEVRKMKPDYMLVLPWHFKNEFIKREKEYLQNGGKLIFPLPTFEIFSN